MTISVVICTRNRGDLIRATLLSVLEGTCRPDELLVVDQSDGDETRRAVESVAAESTGEDGAVRYLATDTRGLSAARNVGLKQSRGEIVAFTDDDVIVCADWLELTRAEFAAYPRLALLFGTVLPPQGYDWVQEYIPYTEVKTCRALRWSHPEALRGIGANMSLRRSTFERVGGFDTHLGAGTPPVGEDLEYALRCLCQRPPLPVQTLDAARVVHHAGARTGADRLRFLKNVQGIGRGLFWAYLWRSPRRPRYVLRAFQEMLLPLGGFAAELRRGRRPSGLRTYGYSLWGLARGLRGGYKKSNL